MKPAAQLTASQTLTSATADRKSGQRTICQGDWESIARNSAASRREAAIERRGGEGHPRNNRLKKICKEVIVLRELQRAKRTATTTSHTTARRVARKQRNKSKIKALEALERKSDTKQRKRRVERIDKIDRQSHARATDDVATKQRNQTSQRQDSAKTKEQHWHQARDDITVGVCRGQKVAQAWRRPDTCR